VKPTGFRPAFFGVGESYASAVPVKPPLKSAHRDASITPATVTDRVTAAAGVAIFDTEHRLLLGKHVHDSRWATFGGAVEPGETTMDAARREVREEIDIEVRDLLLLGTFEGDDIYTVQYQGGAETYAVTMYVCWLAGIIPRPDTELRRSQRFDGFSQNTSTQSTWCRCSKSAAQLPELGCTPPWAEVSPTTARRPASLTPPVKPSQL
jgi:ADP-ribose pyrophosphatase YjhB (NUDIX family)